MRNKRLIIAITGAVLCGMLAVMLVTRYLSNVQAYTKDLGNVVVATTEIPLGAKIVPEQLSLASIPNGSTPEGAFRKIEEVAGRVAITTIGVREPVTTLKLAPEGFGAGLSAVIPEGYRAMTVKVDDVMGVSGFIMPGSFVDVVAVIQPPPLANGANNEPISKIVLQNIKVLASGPRIDTPQNQREPASVNAVTLQVTPSQAEKLVLATNQGRLQLVMRKYGDQESAETNGANRTTLLNGEGVIPQPAPNAEPPKPVKPTVKIVRRSVARMTPKEPATMTQHPAPPPRKSVELIEGNKRRDVDIP
jgi:pilus assembly protein CpaB